MNTNQAYNMITAATDTLLQRVTCGAYHDPTAPNADLQIAARLSAIANEQTAPVRYRHQNAAKLARKLIHDRYQKKELMAVLTRRNNMPDPVGEFTEHAAARVLLAVESLAGLAT
jgi:hypothetical protein